jgi:esterase/lipase
VATTVYDVEEIQLSNGETLVIKPLTIKHLKKFLKVMKKMEDPKIESEEQVMEIFVEGAMVCLEQLKPELAEDIETFEEVIEVPTLMKILEVAGGLKLNDPNLNAANLAGIN